MPSGLKELVIALQEVSIGHIVQVELQHEGRVHSLDIIPSLPDANNSRSDVAAAETAHLMPRIMPDAG